MTDQPEYALLEPGAFSRGDAEEKNALSVVNLVQPESQSGVVQQVVSLPSIMYEPSGHTCHL